jgi:hypothetical protein
MPMTAMREYLQRLPVRKAELKLLLADVISLPYMNKSDRRSALRRWEQDAGAMEQAQPATPGILKMLGIGVRHVKA